MCFGCRRCGWGRVGEGRATHPALAGTPLFRGELGCGSAGTPRPTWWRVFAAVLGLICTVQAVAGERVLRVAADPNNLPFSNERREGFENRIAELVARELGARLEYVWRAQRRGFFRETINEGRADLVIGVAAGMDAVWTTRPYYRSSYVFVQRTDKAAVETLDDPRLREMTIGVQMVGDDFHNTPPAHALSRRGMVANVRGYSLYGDYALESPPAEVVRAVVRGEVDLAIAWGPMAGFFARRQKVPLEVRVVRPERDGPLPFTYAIAMGVKRGNRELKEAVEKVIATRAAEIDAILEEFGVPRLQIGETREEAEDEDDD